MNIIIQYFHCDMSLHLAALNCENVTIITLKIGHHEL